MSKKNKDWVDTFLDRGIDVPGKLIFINGGIDETTLEILVAGLHLIGPDEEVTILINSPGGDLSAGLAMYDVISNYSGTVTARVVGEACSAACILMQGADIREATPHSTIMHHVGEGAIEGHAKNVKMWAEFYEKMLEKVDAIMLSRINERREHYDQEPRSKSWWRERNQFDRWMFPEEAIEFGLLDRIYRR